VRRLWAAQAAVREKVWALGAAGRDAAAPVFLDIDATLVEVHSVLRLTSRDGIPVLSDCI